MSENTQNRTSPTFIFGAPTEDLPTYDYADITPAMLATMTNGTSIIVNFPDVTTNPTLTRHEDGSFGLKLRYAYTTPLHALVCDKLKFGKPPVDDKEWMAAFAKQKKENPHDTEWDVFAKEKLQQLNIAQIETVLETVDDLTFNRKAAPKEELKAVTPAPVEHPDFRELEKRIEALAPGETYSITYEQGCTATITHREAPVHAHSKGEYIVALKGPIRDLGEKLHSRLGCGPHSDKGWDNRNQSLEARQASRLIEVFGELAQQEKENPQHQIAEVTGVVTLAQGVPLMNQGTPILI